MNIFVHGFPSTSHVMDTGDGVPNALDSQTFSKTYRYKTTRTKQQ